MNDIIKEAIKYATKFAAEAHDDFKEVAFQTALQHFLTQNAIKFNVKSTNVNKRTKTKLASQDYLSRLLESDYDWSITNIRDLSPLAQYLKILKIAKTEFQIDTLSSEDVRKILNEKFRINKTINTIGMSLMETVGKYVDRIRQGNGYYYRITSKGEERLQQLEEKSGEKHV